MSEAYQRFNLFWLPKDKLKQIAFTKPDTRFHTKLSSTEVDLKALQHNAQILFALVERQEKGQELNDHMLSVVYRFSWWVLTPQIIRVLEQEFRLVRKGLSELTYEENAFHMLLVNRQKQESEEPSTVLINLLHLSSNQLQDLMYVYSDSSNLKFTVACQKLLELLNNEINIAQTRPSLFMVSIPAEITGELSISSQVSANYPEDSIGNLLYSREQQTA